MDTASFRRKSQVCAALTFLLWVMPQQSFASGQGLQQSCTLLMSVSVLLFICAVAMYLFVRNHRKYLWWWRGTALLMLLGILGTIISPLNHLVYLCGVTNTLLLVMPIIPLTFFLARVRSRREKCLSCNSYIKSSDSYCHHCGTSAGAVK